MTEKAIPLEGPTEPQFQSKVVSIATLGYMDTTAAQICGFTLFQRAWNNKVTIDTLPFTRIRLIDSVRKDTIRIIANEYGKFSKYINPGKYSLRSTAVGFGTLTVKEIQFQGGEKKELGLLLSDLKSENDTIKVEFHDHR